MGGPGRGILFDTRDAPTSSVTIAFNSDRPSRPYSLRDATDPDTPIRGRAGWDRDARERPRTFATAEAAEAFARSHAAAPLVVNRVDLVPRYEPTADQRAVNDAARVAASQFVGEVQAAVDSGDVERFQAVADRPILDRLQAARDSIVGLPGAGSDEGRVIVEALNAGVAAIAAPPVAAQRAVQGEGEGAIPSESYDAMIARQLFELSAGLPSDPTPLAVPSHAISSDEAAASRKAIRDQEIAYIREHRERKHGSGISRPHKRIRQD